MSLLRLAKELEETARQTGEMTSAIIEAIDHLDPPSEDAAVDRAEILKRMMVALQAQDRIEQRCRNLAQAVRGLVASDNSIDHPRFDEIWSTLRLEELAVPELSGIAAVEEHGECEFF